MRKYNLVFIAVFLFACRTENEHAPAHLFELLDGKTVGIDFTNNIKNSPDFNIFSYRNFYNGGGVAIGDINNDGLSDIYLTANMGSNKLYLNKGDWKFEDITEKAGVAEAEKWSTGVVMVDLNEDGLLDIYVCNAGYQENIGQENSLFINNGDLTFTESAKKYGLNDNSYSTHAGFFDYDLDGDLDMYLLNNSFIPANTLNYNNKRELRASEWPVADFLKGGGDKFFRNDDGMFVDISEEAGIYGSLIGFGLGVTIGDVNGDHYPDIYVSNDFFERDYLYINQQDGTFEESLLKWMSHISHSSMGADMADINNDGYPEIFVTDMLPDDEHRLKTTSTFDNINLYRLKQKQGFYHQYMQNTLQLNDGNERFSEIAYFSGVAASDWSWGALMFDADNDAYTDIYVCNGIYHDVTDQDFIDFFANELIQKMALTKKKEELDSVLNKMPSVKIPNKAFRNLGSLKFEDATEKWGFQTPSFSNGSAYGDLDNDGDLDLIVNNVNQPVFIYKNNTDAQSANHYIGIRLKGSEKNRFAVGAKVELHLGNSVINREMIPSRGFQSSIDYQMPIGIGEAEKIDSLKIIWPDRLVTLLTNPPVDTFFNINYADRGLAKKSIVDLKPDYLFTLVGNDFDPHIENDFIDFHYERNIPMMTSQEGPCAAVADVNGDGLEDIYIGGAGGEPPQPGKPGKPGQAGQLYINNGKGFTKMEQAVFDEFKDCEDTAVCFFDADGDGDQDLFVGSGGNEHDFKHRLMQDRIYTNDGKGNFKYSTFALPPNGMNTSVVIPYDFDDDGDIDLFVGSRSVPGNYGIIPANYLLENTGEGRFLDIARSENPDIYTVGMVTDAKWVDIYSGPYKELVVVGEWMAPTIFTYNGSGFEKVATNLSGYEGWWNAVEFDDIDQDGDQDLVLGNLGENFYLKAGKDKPLKLWVNDFDQNRQADKIITRTVNDKDMPVPMKRDLTEQIASLKKKNLKHLDYANKSIQDLFPPKVMEQTQVKQANYMQSAIAINKGNGEFEVAALAPEVQLSCVNDALFTDLNDDGYSDLVMGGNNYDFLPQFSRLDASFGHVLLNDKKGNFVYLPNQLSGLFIEGEVRQLQQIQIGREYFLLALINNQKPVVYRLDKKSKSDNE